jgi:hypothetical protein
LGLAYFYCDYKLVEQQTTVGMIGAIIRQLLRSEAVVPGNILEIYNSRQMERGPLLLQDTEKIFPLTCELFHRVYICVDAIDELDSSHAEALLKSLQASSESVRLLITGRCHSKSRFEGCFKTDSMLEVKIHADSADLTMLLEDRISKGPPVEAELMNESLKAEITKQIIDWSDGKSVHHLYKRGRVMVTNHTVASF